MPLVPAKCTQCGSSLTIESSQDAAVCPFCNTPFITEKAINNYNTTNVTNIEKFHADVVNLHQIYEDDFVIRGGVLTEYRGSSLNVVVPDGIMAISINRYAQYVESIEVPDGCKEIYLSGCSNLQNLVLPKTLKKLTIINAEKLERLELPETLEELEIRYLCSLRSIIVPQNVKLVKINNTGIENIALHEGILKLDCSSCYKLKEVIIPQSVGETADFSFAWCTALERVVLPENIKKLKEGMFERCSSLKTINLPNGLLSIDGTDWEYGDSGAFFLCESLESIVIPKSVTYIGRYAFNGCKNLRNVEIPPELIKVFCSEVEGFETTPFSEKIGKSTSWKSVNRCQYCGGNFKGIFTKVCEKCGKEKDY